MNNEVILSEFDLFSTLPIQNSISNTDIVEYRPIASLEAHTAPLEFVIPGAEEFLDLTEIYLYVKAKVTKPNKVALTVAESDLIAPVNSFLSSLFNHVQVYFNNTLVSSQNDFTYINYLKLLLGTDSETKKSYLSAGVWIHEKNDDTNFIERSKLIRQSRVFDLYGKLSPDVFDQQKLLLSNTDVRIKLNRSKHNFYLQCKGTGKDLNPEVIITDASLFVKRIKPTSTLVNALEQTLLSASAKYFYRKQQSKIFTISAGEKSFFADNLSIGKLPDKILICMCSHNAYNGNFDLNPYDFKHFNLSQINVTVNTETLPTLEFDFRNNNFSRGYYNLFHTLGLSCNNKSNGISMADFEKNCCIIPFDISKIIESKQVSYLNTSKTGILRLHLRFHNDLAEAVTLIVITENISSFEIDSSRQILITE